MFFYLFIAVNNILRNKNLFCDKINSNYHYNTHKSNNSIINKVNKNKVNNNKNKDAALIPLDTFPKNNFYHDLNNNNFSKNYKSIIYPPE